MNAINNEVVEKLKKILRLANDRGAQPGEVESAFARAKEIAMRHGLDIAGIDISGKDDTKSGLDVGRVDVQTRAQHPQKYHRFICAVLQNVFGVAVVRCGRRYTFIGEATDNLICQALFP